MKLSDILNNNYNRVGDARQTFLCDNAITLNEWNHFGVTFYNTSLVIIKLYKDGVELSCLHYYD